MTFQELLNKFENPGEASKAAKLGRTAAWHWFAEGEKRCLPSVGTVVMWADHFELTDEELGSVIRDRGRIREEMHAEYMRLKREGVREKRAEAATRSRQLRKERAESRRQKMQEKSDLKVEQEMDWEQKEKVLEIKRLENIIKENLK